MVLTNDGDSELPGDGKKIARFVTKEELLSLTYLDTSDDAITDYVDII
jgi:hypothetical protein